MQAGRYRLAPDPRARARAAFRAGELDAAALRAAEDVAIRDVIALQREVGCAGGSA